MLRLDGKGRLISIPALQKYNGFRITIIDSTGEVARKSAVIIYSGDFPRPPL